jgi:hypothetical protein
VRLEALLPSDGRLHAVDGRDVGTALAAAVGARCSGRTLLVAGDESTRMTQRELAASVTAALGMRDVIPPGRAGHPTDDTAWFNVDWMDTREAEELLSFQHHTWDDTLAALRAHVGRLRHLLPLVTPAARLVLSRRSPYRGLPEGPADPWGGMARVFGPGALVDG